MADWLEKIKTISSTKGSSAPESAKRAGIGCLSVLVAAVSILTFFIAFGLFRSGDWILGLFAVLFGLMASATVLILILPHNRNSL